MHTNISIPDKLFVYNMQGHANSSPQLDEVFPTTLQHDSYSSPPR